MQTIQDVGVVLQDVEKQCLFTILQRPELANNSADDENMILYSDLVTLIRNFTRKERLVIDSERLGLDYRVLTPTTFDFLLQLKQIDTKTPVRKILQAHVTQEVLSDLITLDLVSFENLFDAVFMKFGVRCPDKQTQEVLKVLFGATRSSGDVFLILDKLERILLDLDFLYVNIRQMVNHPKATENQKVAYKKLVQIHNQISEAIANW